MGWQPGADDDLGNASTHEISWGLSPWSVSYTNDSVFEDGRINATISSSSDSHDEQPFLSDTSTAVLDIRWTMLFSALICLWVAGICLVPMWREQISVRFDTWLVIGAALAVFMLQFGAAEFEDNMRDVAEKDVKRIAPSWNMVFTKSFVYNQIHFLDLMTGFLLKILKMKMILFHLRSNAMGTIYGILCGKISKNLIDFWIILLPLAKICRSNLQKEAKVYL